jgi:hypothetical protein
VSTPEDAIKKDTSQMDIFRKVFHINARKQKNEADGSILRTEFGWPRTQRLNETFEPNWDNDEVHFKVRTHYKDGLPIDLTGAMLHIAVFDGGLKTGTKLIGTFTLNLADLIVRSRQRNRMAPRTSSPTSTVLRAAVRMTMLAGALSTSSPSEQSNEQPANNHPPPEVKGETAGSEVEKEKQKICGVATNGPSERLKATMKSVWFKSGARKKTQTALMQAASLKATSKGGGDNMEMLNIQSLQLDEPLMKNGKEVGRIQCTIDSWWLDDAAASMKKKKLIAQRTA